MRALPLALLGLAGLTAAGPSATAQAYPSLLVPVSGADAGCYYEYQTTAEVRAHSAPTDASQHTRTVGANRLVQWNDYSERLASVLETGVARARRTMRVEFTPVDFGAGTAGRAEAAQLREGETVDVVAYAGGGASVVRRGGRFYVARLPGVFTGGVAEPFALEQAPVVEVWVRLVAREDRPAAWLNVSQAGVVQTGVECGR